jgi:hypothetical protein
MTQTIWVRPKGLHAPRPGTRIAVQLEQNVPPSGRPLHRVGWAMVYEGGQVVLKLTEASEAGRVAVALLREDMIDAVFWGSEPKVRLRP